MSISTIARRFRQERRYQVAGAIVVAGAASLGGVLLTVHGGSGQARPITVDSSYSVSVMDLGSMPKDHHTLRIVSARGDLTGQRELKWAADAGHLVGTARCTKNFRIGTQPSASVKPTMLLCWRLVLLRGDEASEVGMGIGSVADRLLRDCPCSLLLVRTGN